MAGRKIRAMALEIVNRDWRTRVRVMSVDIISHIHCAMTGEPLLSTNVCSMILERSRLWPCVLSSCCVSRKETLDDAYRCNCRRVHMQA